MLKGFSRLEMMSLLLFPAIATLKIFALQFTGMLVSLLVLLSFFWQIETR
jgi:hypothetical protein